MGRRISKAAIARLLPSDGPDPIDGSEQNAALRRAFELVDRTIDDLTDAEVILRQTDEGWFVNFCLDELRRLPSEVEPFITMRECTLIQARGIARAAQAELARVWSSATAPGQLP